MDTPVTTVPTVLVVDDEARALETIARTLGEEFDVVTATGANDAEKILREQWVQVILCDQRMPGLTGVEFLKRVREEWPDVVRMMISGYTDPDDVIDAVNEAGILQYITKPWHPDNLLLIVRNAVRMYQLQRENELLALELKVAPATMQDRLLRQRNRVRDSFNLDGIVRNDGSPIEIACEQVRRVAPYDVSVLLTGESGTGKELFARALHYSSLRADKPFVAENCGALPDELLESELFGHKKGAFTGAVSDRSGLFEQADGGTIFLDEIGDISPAFQVKLLRVLQEGEIRPLGSNQRRRVNIRVIAATNRNLEEDVHAGRFRRDLYYRLATITVHLPPLRERKGDIPVLVNALLASSMHNLGKCVKGFTDEALMCLQAYDWPGNVRELQNEIQRMLVMGQEDSLGAELLSPRVLRAVPPGEQGESDLLAGLSGTLKEQVETLESRILRETLIRCRWNKTRAAEELGLSRVGLRNKLERYGLERKLDS